MGVSGHGKRFCVNHGCKPASRGTESRSSGPVLASEKCNLNVIMMNNESTTLSTAKFSNVTDLTVN